MNIIKITALAMVAPICVAFQSCASHDKSQSVEQRVDELLGRMTLQEKIGQMNQLHQISFENQKELEEAVRAGAVGSFLLNDNNPDYINNLQRIAVEETRLGIPLLMSRDVIHGYRTIFPIPLGQAATFNPELVEAGARVAAVEATADGIRWTFAPMVDISRDARWGRIIESLGEDPYLSSLMGAAMVRGFQGDSLSAPTSMAACAKHYAGYGAAESGKDYNSTYLTERVLRNVYLPPFEAAALAGCATFMTSFNDNDGVPSTANPFLLRQVLRDEWNFDGMVVTDWEAIKEMIDHGFSKDLKHASEQALKAGVDMDMVSRAYAVNLEDLVKEGRVSESEIDNAVRNILRLKFRLGLFDDPYVRKSEPDVMYAPDHLALARQAAEQSVVMLKNDNDVLPLGSDIRTIAVVGPMADAPHDQLGSWSFDGEKEHTQTPLKALREIYGDSVNIIYEPALAYCRDNSPAGISKAVAAARRADVVIAFVGEEAIVTGEGHSLADINLLGAQKQLIKELSQTGKPLVTVFMAGRPLTIIDEVEASDAVLYSFHPGTMGGPAIADILFGKVSPSGKTPVSFARTTGQLPVYYAHNNTGRPAAGNEILLKDVPVEAPQTSLGNRAYFLDAGYGPLFPFGYGLSYADFKYDGLKLASDKLRKDDTLEVCINLSNTGKYEGTEVVQLYVTDKVGSVTRPVKELKGFQRVSLLPGETKTVRFTLPVAELAFYDFDMNKTVEPGDFTVMVGTNSDEGLMADFEIL